MIPRDPDARIEPGSTYPAGSLGNERGQVYYERSIAISLKRIADALDILAEAARI